MKKKTNVAVVGAGVVGLSTALRVKQAIPSVNVTIIADKFMEETTSDGAAGIFRPTLGKTPGVSIPLLKSWLRDSWNHFHQIAFSPEAGEAGIQLVSGHRFINSPLENELEADFIYCNRRLSRTEMDKFPEECRKYKYGWFVTTLVTEPRRYMPYLMKQFLELGGNVLRKKIAGFEEVIKIENMMDKYCQVDAPWIKHCLYTGDAATMYIIPGIEYITVGGTRQENDTDTRVRKTDTDVIWKNACEAIPALKRGRIVRQWAGLRPHRVPLRLERERKVYPAGNVQIIHNYGHGAEGVGLSWGTACHASRLVEEALVLQSSKL